MIGIDGEAIDGEYRILGSSSYSQLSLRGQLTSSQCFDFLIDCAGRGHRLVGYGIGYDVSNWVRDLSNSELDRLYRNGRCYTEQGLRFYRVSYTPNIMFRVDRLAGVPFSKRGRKTIGTAIVVDVMRWHRKPFANVTDDWELGTNEQRVGVRSVKEDRPIFSNACVPLIERYNRTECDMIAELAEEMEFGFRLLGLPVPRPFTCGAVAGVLASKYRVQDYHSELPEHIVGPVQSAFFGGREQTCRFGKFENCSHFDIRSAYSWAMSQLPDMLGDWAEPFNDFYSPTGWGLRKVRWSIPEGEYPVMPFPHRDKSGNIHYPPNGTGWYWSCLVGEAVKHYPEHCFEILDGRDYIPLSPKIKPFWYMEELHGCRMALKAAGDPLEGLLKLVMVSTWGRMCSDGVRHNRGLSGHKKSPTRGLLDWAGMTTALIQTELLRAIMLDPSHFISCCVDGYWTTGRGPSPGNDLGDWSVEQASKLFLIRQSCYWKQANVKLSSPTIGSRYYREAEASDSEASASEVSGGDSIGSRGIGWSAHTSGVADGLSVLKQASDEWETRKWRGNILVNQRRCNGLIECGRLGAGYDNLGQFCDTKERLKLNPGFGRYGHIDPTMVNNGCSWEKWLPYWPPVSYTDTESEPFKPKCDRDMEEDKLSAVLKEMAE